jgi:hypothetical protein
MRRERRKKRKYTRKAISEAKIKTQKDVDAIADSILRVEGEILESHKEGDLTIIDKVKVEKVSICPLCNDRGSIDLDKIGLVTKFCTCEAGKRLRERVRETGGIR